MATAWAEEGLHRVDCGMSLADTLQRHDAWLEQHGVKPGGRSCLPVTWTDWDLKVRLLCLQLVPHLCQLLNMQCIAAS